MKKQLLGALVASLLAIAPAAATTRVETPGGWYGERGTDGRRAVIVDGAYVQTHLGRVELPRVAGLPDLPLHLRITPIGEFKMCGQSHRGAGTWEWAHGEWHVAGPSYGVNACIYDHAGRLHIGALAFGSQGFRWVNADNSLVTGDLTYADPSRQIWEFTEQLTPAGKVTIGQGENGCIALRGDSRFMLEPGHCTVARYTHANGVNAVFMVKLLERKAVELAFPDSELATFPPETVITPTPEICDNGIDDNKNGLTDEGCAIDPDPEPTACGEIPAHGQDVLRRLWARPDVNVLVRSPDDDDRRRSARMFAEQLAYSVDRGWGTKNAGGGRPPSKDAVARRVDGVLCGWDIVNGTTRELNFGHGEPLPGQEFISVEPIDHVAGGTVDPDPDPDPSIEALKKRIAELAAENADLTEAHEHDLAELARLRDELTARAAELHEARTEIERLKNQAAPTCRVTGPGWVRDAFRIRCEIVR